MRFALAVVALASITACPDPPKPEPRCGDGVVDDGEQCDSDDLAGATCVDAGFRGGTIACDESCTLSFRGCVVSVCGDGQLDDRESCDDANSTDGDGCDHNCAVETGEGE